MSVVEFYPEFYLIIRYKKVAPQRMEVFSQIKKTRLNVPNFHYYRDLKKEH